MAVKARQGDRIAASRRNNVHVYDKAISVYSGAVGLYALQTVLRKVRSLNTDESSQERLKALSNELRVAVQDRFEQLELLPFRS